LRHPLLVFGPPIAQAAIIFWLSAQPHLPSTPGGDKVAHLTVYGILSFLVARALYLGTGLPISSVFFGGALISTLYGISDEIHQIYVPGRSSDVMDVCADAVGCLLGAAAIVILHRWWPRQERK